MYRFKINSLIIIALNLFLVGCASTTVEHFRIPTDEVAESENKGIRYYENAPFILVYSTKGHYTSKFIWLPDVSSISSATPFEFLASNELHLTLKDGVLTSGQTIGDSTKIASAIITVAKDLALAAAKASASAAANEIDIALAEKVEIKPRVYLYRLGTGENDEPILYGDSREIVIMESN